MWPSGMVPVKTVRHQKQQSGNRAQRLVTGGQGISKKTGVALLIRHRGHCELLWAVVPPLQVVLSSACSVASLGRFPSHYLPGRPHLRMGVLADHLFGWGIPSTRQAGHATVHSASSVKSPYGAQGDMTLPNEKNSAVKILKLLFLLKRARAPGLATPGRRCGDPSATLGATSAPQRVTKAPPRRPRAAQRDSRRDPAPRGDTRRHPATLGTKRPSAALRRHCGDTTATLRRHHGDTPATSGDAPAARRDTARHGGDA